MHVTPGSKAQQTLHCAVTHVSPWVLWAPLEGTAPSPASRALLLPLPLPTSPAPFLRGCAPPSATRVTRLVSPGISSSPAAPAPQAPPSPYSLGNGWLSHPVKSTVGPLTPSASSRTWYHQKCQHLMYTILSSPSLLKTLQQDLF